MSKLTDEQKSMLRYFWEEKGDITKYCEFEKLKPAIHEEHPELLKAWYDYQVSIKIMDVVCKSL